MEAPKPRSLTETEWREVRRANYTGLFRYAFAVRQLWIGLAALFCGTFVSELFRLGGKIKESFQATLHSGVVLGLVFFALLFIFLRTIDWLGKRKTAKAAGL